MIAEMASPVATLCSGLTSEPLAVQSHCFHDSHCTDWRTGQAAPSSQEQGRLLF